MTVRDFMKKEVEIDIIKCSKDAWNGIIALLNKLPRCINPEIKKNKAWPDESMYKTQRSDPLELEPRELEVVDDGFEDLLQCRNIPQALSRGRRGRITVNGKKHTMTSMEERAMDVAIQKLDDMTNALTNRITVDIDNSIDDMEEELNNLVEEMFGSENKWGFWDSHREYPIDIKGRDITGRMIENNQPMPPKDRKIKD